MNLFKTINQIQIKDKYASFENIQYAIKHPYDTLILNTLSTETQRCLIYNTVNIINEEQTINEMINSLHTPDKHIFIYGKNTTDRTVNKKYDQLIALGIDSVYIYSGGLFEWLLLQDIYGTEEFPTTSRELDLLYYRPKGINSLLR
mgnify:CR=1 FL=1|jgi:hypothetical protein